MKQFSWWMQRGCIDGPYKPTGSVLVEFGVCWMTSLSNITLACRSELFSINLQGLDLPRMRARFGVRRGVSGWRKEVLSSSGVMIIQALLKMFNEADPRLWIREHMQLFHASVCQDLFLACDCGAKFYLFCMFILYIHLHLTHWGYNWSLVMFDWCVDDMKQVF